MATKRHNVPALNRLHPLEYLIVVAVHTQPRVDLLRDRVSPIHVESNTTHGGIGLGQILYVRIETGVDPLFTDFGNDINTLNPPHQTIAPVTPLVRDESRTNNAAVRFA